MLVAFLIFLLCFGAVLMLERVVHRRLHELFLLITGHMESATIFYSLVLLPGVALHEVSHALMAMLLGVKVRKLSLWPERQRNGTVRLGYVEVLRSDNLRSSLIGVAPLLAGVIALILIGLYVFNLESVQAALSSGSAEGVLSQLVAIRDAPDSWLWIYLVFAIANSMMPSQSDTQSWPPVIGFIVVLGAALVLIGGTGLLLAIAPTAQFVLRWLAAAFALTVFIDVIVVVVLSLITKVLEAVTGRRVEFK